MQNYTTSYIVCRLPIKTVLGGKKKIGEFKANVL